MNSRRGLVAVEGLVIGYETVKKKKREPYAAIKFFWKDMHYRSNKISRTSHEVIFFNGFVC